MKRRLTREDAAAENLLKREFEKLFEKNFAPVQLEKPALAIRDLEVLLDLRQALLDAQRDHQTILRRIERQIVIVDAQIDGRLAE
jgi:hypothetical protein